MASLLLGGLKNPFKKKDPPPGDGEPEPDDGTGGDGGGGDGEEEDPEEGMVRDTKVVTIEGFYKLQAQKYEVPERGETKELQRHWARPRRWQVRLWNIEFQNEAGEEMTVFLNFIFGGNREEFKVKDGGKTRKSKIWVCGKEGATLRTPVVNDVPGDDDGAEMNFDEHFEWRGSYLDLESQLLRIELWNWSRLRVNKFDSWHEDTLLSYASGNIFNEIECVKVLGPGRKKIRAKVQFSLYFQEIYDFELNFECWRATNTYSVEHAIKRLEKLEENGGDVSSDSEESSESDGSDADSDASKVDEAAALQHKHIMKTLKLVTPRNLRQYCRSKTFQGIPTPGVSPNWGAMGQAWFRGTISDLYNGKVDVTVYSDEDHKKFGISSWSRGRYGMTKTRIPLGVASLPLHGVLEQGDRRTMLKPADWFREMEGADYIPKLRVGYVEGNVNVPNKPRFQQLDLMEDDYESNKRYLFCKVQKIENVVIPDDMVLSDEMGLFVEATFDSVNRRTKVKKDLEAPAWNEELKWEIVTNRLGKDPLDDTSVTWQEIQSKGPVHFDLWTQGSISNEHLGYCNAYLAECIEDEKGQPQKIVEKTVEDKQKKVLEKFEVRRFLGVKKLSFIAPPSRTNRAESTLHIEMWILPDLNKKAILKKVKAASELPKALRTNWDEWKNKWEQRTASLDRFFPITCKTQMQDEYFLPRFLDVVKPPRPVDTRNAVSHYIGCMPYIPKREQQDFLAFTPEFFNEIRKGETLDHALLHCSFLLGLMQKAYVCLGTTLQHERHAWVATFEPDGSIKFWEPFLSTGTYTLQDRLAHPEFVLGARIPKKLSEKEIRWEMDRRKRLQKLGARHLNLMNDAVDDHEMNYGDVSSWVNEGLQCVNCGRHGGDAGFQRGFYCRNCQTPICWGCADQYFLDRAELDGMAFDPRQPFQFEVNQFSLIMPYRSVEVVFNNNNIWANLQDKDPAKIFWDLCNPTYWHQFAAQTGGLRPCFRGVHFPVPRDEAWKNRVKRSIQARVAAGIRRARSAKNLSTSWVRNPVLIGYLEAGLQIRMHKEMAPDHESQKLKDRLEEWESLLLAKTLDKHKVRGQPMHFNFCEPSVIADDVVNQCGFLDAREKSAQFCIAVEMATLPGEVVSVLVYIIEVHEMSDNDIEKELEKRKEAENKSSEDDLEVLFAAFTEAQNGSGGKTLGDLLLESVAKAKEAGGGELPIPSEASVMTGFHESRHGKQVEVKDSGLTVEYKGDYEMYGGAMGDFPILATPDGKYFEVCINKVRNGGNLPDGLAIGVTTRGPATVPEMPLTMDNVTPCWMCGFYGAFFDGAQMIPVDWRPQYLSAGDHVGFLVATPGVCKVFVNGAAVCKWEGDIPCDSPLFATVDLIGMTQAISLVQGAKPPTGDTPWVKIKNMKHFDRKKHGMHVHLSDDGMIASRKEGKQLYSLVIGDGPIPAVAHEPESVYYEVKVEQVLADEPDGMAIGVTSTAPEKVPGEMPQTIDGLEAVWAVGFDGQAYDGSTSSWHALEWQSRDLNAGDRVGIFVSGEGKMRILVNEFPVADGPTGIPRDKPLYAVLDLLGNTRSVSYQLGADCPQLEMALLPQDGDTPAVDTLKEMTGFSSTVCGMNVRLSQDGITAVFTGETGKEMFGGLVGNSVLKKRKEEDLYYFEVRVDSVRPGLEEGMAIGVTTQSPGQIKEDFGSMPESVDELEESFLVGFDGSEWDGGKLFWSGSPWQPSTLQTDDHVGILIDNAGHMSVFVNGDGITQCKFAVPMDKNLFAVVDLIGATGGVSFVPNGTPPATKEIKAARRKADKFVTVLKDDPKVNPLPKPKEEMRGFSSTAIGKRVRLSPNTLSLSYVGADNDLFGGAVGDGTIPEITGGCYFEVQIDEVSSGAPDGFAIGVTDKGPEEVKKIPETMDKFKKTWLVGYVGECWDGSKKEWMEVNWYPSELKAGDRVGVFIGSGSRNMFIYVNGRKRVDGPRKIPDGPLHAVIDLIGNTRAVTYIPGAQPPSEKKAAAPAVLRGGFSRAAHGANVILTDEGTRAKHKEGDDLHGIIMTADPLIDVGHGRRYFEIVVNEVDKGQPDGMAIGVTTRRPEEVRSMPSSADMLRPSWLVGFDGAWWDGKSFEWGISEWNTRELNPRDLVGVSVSGKGELSITVNGNWVTGGPKTIPNEPLYGLVDLLGAIRCVGLNQGARPPGIQSSASTGKPKREQEAGGEPPMKGFSLKGHSKTLVVTPDGQKATRARIGNEALQGVIIGDGPIAPNSKGDFSYEFYIGATESGAEDGLAVGVTTRSPTELRQLPETADQLDPSWLVGFDGAAWDGAIMSWEVSPWNPSNMLVGDVVRMVITKQNEIQVYVNRRKVCSHHMHLPKDNTKLYALWDLNGNTAGVSFTKPAMPDTAGGPRREVGTRGKEYMSAFDKAKSGAQMKISASGVDASRADTATFGCVLLGNFPLEPDKNKDVSYTVAVTSVREGLDSGMAAGVTTVAPAEMAHPPANAEEVDPAWLVGFDGSTWDGETGEWGFSNWNSTELVVGDLVKVAVTAKHELQINVNGVRKCSHPLHLPAGRDFYALMDLAGTTSGIHLVVGDADKPKAHAATMAPGLLGNASSAAAALSFVTGSGSQQGSDDATQASPERKKKMVFRHPDGRVVHH